MEGLMAEQKKGGQQQAAKKDEKSITSRSANYSEWYQDIVYRAGLAENSDVRGCMVIKPNGFAVWEKIQRALDGLFKDTGHVNAYFPLFIPKGFFQREEEMAEGFAKECAVVTHYRLRSTNGKIEVDPEAKLEEELIIRPTSETIIWNTYKNWIQSYRDLPLLINQWCNVVRWEMRTRLFLSTAELLGQEGHTAHRTEEEAQEETLKMLEVYRAFAEEDLAIPVHKGAKTESEKFPGAVTTYSIEALMRDGKALQAGTSHHLGQHFAKVYDITFQDQDGERRHVQQTSWGVSTRLIGALIMSHGDDQGLRLPPRIAPVQAVIVPIYRKDEEKASVLAFAARVREALLAAGVRVRLDDRDQHTPGWKYNEWELRGVPVRVEVGPRDVAKESVVFVRRDDRAKAFVPMAEVGPQMTALLEQVQQALFDRAELFRRESTRSADDLAGMSAILREHRGFVSAPWCGDAACEAAIKAETQATIRNLPLDAPEEKGACVRCGRPSRQRVLFAKAY
jgi:prolyl-tRNA synthetase